jgi:hypothetical protein
LQIHGLGSYYSYASDEDLLYTAHTYRHVLISDLTGVASPAARLRFYFANIEHSMAEANVEIRNSSFVDFYSTKGEGSVPIMIFNNAHKWVAARAVIFWTDAQRVMQHICLFIWWRVVRVSYQLELPA